MVDEKPYLYVIAGVNGSGKTTLVKQLSPELIFGIPFINADEIARSLRDSYPNKKQNALNMMAGRTALKLSEEYIKRQQSFAIETTLTGHSPLNTMQLAKNNGFNIELFYVGLATIEHSVARVQERVRAGGHSIPIEDIERRFKRSFNNLPEAIQLADKILILDNTMDKHRKILSIDQGIVKEVHQTQMPTWLSSIIDTNDLLKNKPISFKKEVEHSSNLRLGSNKINNAEQEQAFLQAKKQILNEFGKQVKVQEPNCKDGTYRGQAVLITDKYVGQRLGANTFILHNKAQLIGDYTKGKFVSIQYNNYKGLSMDVRRVKEKGKEQDIER